MHRLASSVVPAENPWKGVERDTTKKTKPAATRAEAYALAEPSGRWASPSRRCGADLLRVAAAARARACWRHHVGRLPPCGPARCGADPPPQDGREGLVPSEDAGGPLYPELEAYLADLPRLGLPIVLTAGERGPARPYSVVYAQRRVREARSAQAGRSRHARCLSAWRHDRAWRCRTHGARRDVALDAQDAASGCGSM